VVLLSATVFALDWLSGPLSLRSLFVVPVVVAGWSLGRFHVLGLALFALVSVAMLDVFDASPLPPSFVVSDAGSRFLAFLLVGELASRARAIRARAEENATRLQSVLDAATEVAIVAWSPRGVFVTFNRGAESLLGWRADEIVGSPEAKLTIAPEEMEAYSRELSEDAGREVHGFDALVERARSGHADERDWTVVRKDGSKRTLHLVVTAQRDAASTIVGYVGVAVDVTERRQAEQILREKNEELRAFAYTVSHDLKAPLRGISGYAQELEEKHSAGLTKRASFCLVQIHTAARNLDRLIEDLLRYSRLLREDVVLHDVDLEAAVRSILLDRRSVIEELGTQVEVDLAAKTGRTWERGLLQILGNLIDNAIKYSRGSQPPKIRIESSRADDGGTRLRVTDNGIGFDQRYAERIFGLFNRLSQPAEYTGTGAGLAIAMRMAEKLGGTISAVSSPGHGASFTVDLPPGGKAQAKPEAIPDRKPRVRSPAVRPMLFVEDSVMDVDLTLRAFEEHGISNVVCRDGDEALRYMQAHSREDDPLLPSLVLLDLRLPNVDGLDVLRAIRAHATWRNMPVIVLTTSSEGDDVARAYALGANSYIVKPVESHAFHDAVRAIERYWLRINRSPYPAWEGQRG
jgi:PAS domain S-box-containing protein